MRPLPAGVRGRPVAAADEPFTARPAARQLTLGEAAAGYELDPTRRTALHDEHLRLGARMDRFGGWWRPWTYGDVATEYAAVRTAVSVGDVSTLGKLVVSGPDVVEALERLYPCHVHDIRPGRSRYALVLNERGHLIDDGMICRDGDTRFTLTFTSGGASAAEMWVRDWIETWRLRVHVLDRTMSLGAINVTGPRAADLLARLGLPDPPRFLRHDHRKVAGVDCHVMRLSFTGEASFELHHPLDRSVALWRALLEAGADLGVRPHGLQALFGLRLEKGHIIVGQDTELDSSPRRVGMDWAVKMDKPDFLGRRALERTAPLPDDRRLHGFTMPGPAPLEGSVIRDGGAVVGQVTSSFDSPVLGHAVLLGWLRRRPFPTEVEIDGRPAVVTDHALLRPGGCSCAGLSSLHAWRVVADPDAVDALAARGARLVLRIAPDDALVLDDQRARGRRSARRRRGRAGLRRLGARARRGRGAGPPSHRVGAAGVPAGRPIQPGAGIRGAGPGQALAPVRRIGPPVVRRAAGRRAPGAADVNEFVETLVDLRWAEPKRSYDVVIIGGGGHGLSTAYHLATRHGITDVAVLERDYIGSGNSGRNTTIIRANYGLPEAVRFYQHSLELYQRSRTRPAAT